MGRWNMSVAPALLALVVAARGATTIDPAHPHAYGANVGWVNTRGDATNGAVIGRFYCVGHLYGANVGWISLGSGTPANGYAYANVGPDDWGVNHDGTGRLTGYAYGANIGWLVFEQTTGMPRVDLRTGALSGCVWGANVGWIGLNNDWEFVRTQTLDSGPDDDGDGLPDAWEIAWTDGLTALHGGGTDGDGDGVSDTDEYGADTHPLDEEDFLRIVAFEVIGETNRVEWSSRPTRLYRLEGTNTLNGSAGNWEDVGGGLLGPPAAFTAVYAVPGVTALTRFYRVKAALPLP